jgi:hypothetical protein
MMDSHEKKLLFDVLKSVRGPGSRDAAKTRSRQFMIGSCTGFAKLLTLPRPLRELRAFAGVRPRDSRYFLRHCRRAPTH